MKYKFKGLKEWDVQPHYLKDFTKDKIYDTYIDDDGFTGCESDNGDAVILSDNKIKEYFEII